MGNLQRSYVWIYGLIWGCMILFIGCKNTTQSADDRTIHIGFSQAMTTDEWRQQMNKSMRIEAALHPEVALDIRDAQNDVNQQVKDIGNLIKTNPDVLIVSPIASEPITSVVQKAYEHGIPVLIVDRKIQGESFSAFLGADNIEVGRTAANYIAANSTGSGKVIEITGLEESSPAYERALGFAQGLRKYPAISIVATIHGDWEKTSVKTPLRKLFSERTDIEYVFAHNDRMAQGAWEVAQSMGLEHQIKFVGVDGLNTPNGGIQLVKKGKLEATVLYPTGGNEALKLALEIVQGKSFARNYILNTIVINKMNAELMENQMNKIDQQQAIMDSQQQAIQQQEAKYTSQNTLLKLVTVLFLLAVGLAGYSIYSTLFIKKKKRELESTNQMVLEQKERLESVTEQLQQSHEAMANFFTGMSHEFKTPLTLIIGYTEALMQNSKFKGMEIVGDIRQIYFNSNRLLRLMNQLLDFRKIEERSIQLQVARIELVEFTNRIMKFFKQEAIKRNITFKFICDYEAVYLHADRDYLDKIYFNMLSNAFKFTPNNGTITIAVYKSNASELVLQFKDTGIGIPEEELETIFQPFFQASNNTLNSSGIGLHLVSYYMKLHKGSIEVNCKHGTEFSLYFPDGSAQLSLSEAVSKESTRALDIWETKDTELEATIKPYPISNQKDTGSERYRLLIIEDHLDIVIFLEKQLRDEFDIYSCNGTNAEQRAMELIPDMILCDVNLPERDGFEISAAIKQDLRTSHIPIIILSAFSSTEFILKGLQAGVDMYLTKPFNLSILKQSLATVLYNREKLRYYFTHNLHRIEEGTREFGSQEQEFLLHLNQIIEINFDNPEFTVEMLAEKLHISRVQLYRKVKAILGHSISDHMNYMKMERAKKLLNEGKMNISEIAYKLGFSSPNYFSTTFKAKFGMSPREFQTNARSS
ncbi:ABC-type sugar transport system, substrate-binding protein, contains N-terminal xre family HTH domain [Pustulibacterium marinum]|uniref:histidine kinase n=1 Tax=Pustulibacterium marinum TaxID=1224947 RepID=A0A1I7H6D3_9FLAO|nr:substrate-binding domain-containing protein [Pustulibacterium marinum]SFU56273.1 ABC-type sugar transport system, substrate-binding protein, contains N-terminal xre family HTH domain [Pustulibacterium marinum]